MVKLPQSTTVANGATCNLQQDAGPPACFGCRSRDVRCSEFAGSNSMIYRVHRLQATQNPDIELTPDTIIEQLDPVEAARLDKVRNIGIAVRNNLLELSSHHLRPPRPISTRERQQLQNACFFTLVESRQYMRCAAKML